MGSDGNMISDEEIVRLSSRFVEMSAPMRAELRRQFVDADLRYAGTTVTDEQDVHFYARCTSKWLPDPWILAIHMLSSGNDFVFTADVVEEESCNIWWQCNSTKGPAQSVQEFLSFMLGGLFSGTCIAIERWTEYSGNCGAMQVNMVMNS